MKCDNCHWHSDDAYESGYGWCLMFRTAPASLPDACAQFALSAKGAAKSIDRLESIWPSSE